MEFIILNTIIDELKSEKNWKKIVYEFININSSCSQFEFFVNYILLDGFWASDKLYNEIKKKLKKFIRIINLFLLFILLLIYPYCFV